MVEQNNADNHSQRFEAAYYKLEKLTLLLSSPNSIIAANKALLALHAIYTQYAADLQSFDKKISDSLGVGSIAKVALVNQRDAILEKIAHLNNTLELAYLAIQTRNLSFIGTRDTVKNEFNVHVNYFLNSFSNLVKNNTQNSDVQDDIINLNNEIAKLEKDIQLKIKPPYLANALEHLTKIGQLCEKNPTDEAFDIISDLKHYFANGNLDESYYNNSQNKNSHGVVQQAMGIVYAKEASDLNTNLTKLEEGAVQRSATKILKGIDEEIQANKENAPNLRKTALFIQTISATRACIVSPSPLTKTAYGNVMQMMKNDRSIGQTIYDAMRDFFASIHKSGKSLTSNLVGFNEHLSTSTKVKFKASPIMEEKAKPEQQSAAITQPGQSYNFSTF